MERNGGCEGASLTVVSSPKDGPGTSMTKVPTPHTSAALGAPESELTCRPASIVADTIVRTIDLGVTITDAAVDDDDDDVTVRVGNNSSSGRRTLRRRTLRLVDDTEQAPAYPAHRGSSQLTDTT